MNILFKNLTIEASEKFIPDDVWEIIKNFMFFIEKNDKYMIINLDYYFYNCDRIRLLDKIRLNSNFIDNKNYPLHKYGFSAPVDVPDKLLLFIFKNLPINIYINKISNEKNVAVPYTGKELEKIITKENRRRSSSEEEWQEQKIPGIILKTKISRPSITKLIYMYVDLKNLKLKTDRRITIPDKNLRELFGEALEDGENLTFRNFQTKLLQLWQRAQIKDFVSIYKARNMLRK